jgi:hypothetical protein
MPNEFNQIGKPPGTFRDHGAWMIHLPGRVPQNVKFKIGRRTFMAFLKLGQARIHDLLSDGQRHLQILRITARPEFALDLKPRNFTARSDGVIIVAAFNHRKRRPPIHGRGNCYQPKTGQNQNYQASSYAKPINGNAEFVNNSIIVLNITNKRNLRCE